MFVEILGWNIGMTALAAFALLVGALVIGIAAQLIGQVRVGWEWIATAVAAFVGGYFASEALSAVTGLGPEFEGLYLLPAAVGALVIGAAFDAVLRYATEGSYAGQAHPA